MSQSNQDYILQLCRTLAAKNITPTLATIRNQSAQPLAIPEVIRVLKLWKLNPEAVLQQLVTSDKLAPPALTLEQRVHQLEAQVHDLTAQLERLLNTQSDE